MKYITIKPLGIRAQKIVSISEMARGLMFSKKKNLLFAFQKEQKIGIHMLFVFFPIIVVWLDKNKRIIKMKVMKPFISFHEEKAKYILEVPYNGKLFGIVSRSRRLRF